LFGILSANSGECVVADAVTVELVSAAIFPANREKNRDYRRSRLFYDRARRDRPIVAAV
jgi:hypothetical protein